MAFANDCLDVGYTSLRSVPEVSMDQATAGTVALQMRGVVTGAPIDLTAYGIYNSSSSSSSSSGAPFTGVRAVVKELPGDSVVWATPDVEVIDAVNGNVKLVYTAQDTRRAGIFTAELQIWEEGVRRQVYPFFMIVNPSLSGSPAHSNQMLSIAEIRMTMRDTDPEGNFLIDELDFKTNEIALMVRRCVDYWNEQPPPVARYKPTNFPFRYHLSIAVVAELHKMAAIHKMRGDLPYQAGGLTIQDTIKWQQYRQLGVEMWDRWVDWVKHKKYEINIEGGYVQLRSGYGLGYYSYR